MTVSRSAFSERLFEFAFNAEFMEKNIGQIIGMPDIPSQNEEKWLGYDVAFEMQNGPGVIDVLALQHKVSRLVDGGGNPINTQFGNVAGNIYLAFPVDPFQFNTIEALLSQGLPGLTFNFCAPLFVDRVNLNARYAAKDLNVNSIYIDVTGVGQLDVTIPHSIVYTPAGNQAWVFSEEPKMLKASRDVQRRDEDKKRKDPLSDKQIRELYSSAFDVIYTGYQENLQAKLTNALPDGPRGIAEYSQLVRRFRDGAPERQNFDNEGECLVAISRLFADYLDATTIVRR